MRSQTVVLATLLLLLCGYTCDAKSKGHLLKPRPRIPEPIKFAAGIHNNHILGHFRRFMNWTEETLGREPKDILKHCTKSSTKDGPLCAQVPMPTPWTKDVDLENPLPEYPRPQLQRTKWLSLNGIWHFKSRGVESLNADLESWEKLPSHRIVVPFPVESYLSGITSHDVNNVNMQYTRKFDVPKEWRGQRIILHFDAVDHTSTVFVNGKKAGSHIGGYDRFSMDITDLLKEGTNELSVHAFDPTEFAHIPIGKQRIIPPRHPSSIWYMSTSGIWQTVWLEPVPEAYIKRVELVPDIDDKSIKITVHGSPAARDAPVTAEVTANNNAVASGSGTVGKPFSIDIPEPHLWSPDSPFLYDLELSLDGDSPHSTDEVASASQEGGNLSNRRLKGLDSFMDLLFGGGGGGGSKQIKTQGHKLRAPKSGGSRDSVTSYFGMRKSSMGKTPDGGMRPMINNEFVFQTGMLDQGFWPDGLYTPSTDAALIWDLEFTKEMGYNMLRKHTKVESDRWYYHADRLGVLVWQDMPSMFFQAGPGGLSDADRQNYKDELTHLIEQHYNFPCIVTWVIFNEGWGQHDTVEVVKYAQSLDSSRIFDGASGWVDHDVGDLVDMHNYVGPGAPNPTATRASVLGEFGGLGRRMEGHMWIPDDAFAYEMHLTAKDLEDRLTGLYAACGNLMEDVRFHLSASVYTELSDVEAEINGWVTYDRQVKKVNTRVLKEANSKLIARSKALNTASVKPRVQESTAKNPAKGSKAG